MSRSVRKKSKLGEDDDNEEDDGLFPLKFEHLRIKSRRTDASTDSTNGEQSSAAPEGPDKELARLRDAVSSYQQHIKALEGTLQATRDECEEQSQTIDDLNRQLSDASERDFHGASYEEYGREKITRQALQIEQLTKALTKARTYLTPTQLAAVQRASEQHDGEYVQSRWEQLEREENDHWATQFQNLWGRLDGNDEGVDDEFDVEEWDGNDDEWRDADEGEDEW